MSSVRSASIVVSDESNVDSSDAPAPAPAPTPAPATGEQDLFLLSQFVQLSAAQIDELFGLGGASGEEEQEEQAGHKPMAKIQEVLERKKVIMTKALLTPLDTSDTAFWVASVAEIVGQKPNEEVVTRLQRETDGVKGVQMEVEEEVVVVEGDNLLEVVEEGNTDVFHMALGEEAMAVDGDSLFGEGEMALNAMELGDGIAIALAEEATLSPLLLPALEAGEIDLSALMSAQQSGPSAAEPSLGQHFFAGMEADMLLGADMAPLMDHGSLMGVTHVNPAELVLQPAAAAAVVPAVSAQQIPLPEVIPPFSVAAPFMEQATYADPLLAVNPSFSVAPPLRGPATVTALPPAAFSLVPQQVVLPLPAVPAPFVQPAAVTPTAAPSAAATFAPVAAVSGGHQPPDESSGAFSSGEDLDLSRSHSAGSNVTSARGPAPKEPQGSLPRRRAPHTRRARGPNRRNRPESMTLGMGTFSLSAPAPVFLGAETAQSMAAGTRRSRGRPAGPSRSNVPPPTTLSSAAAGQGCLDFSATS